VLTENAAHELTYFVALEWEGADRQALAPLVDAALVWAYPNQMAELALPIVESLWADGLGTSSGRSRALRVRITRCSGCSMTRRPT